MLSVRSWKTVLTSPDGDNTNCRLLIYPIFDKGRSIILWYSDDTGYSDEAEYQRIIDNSWIEYMINPPPRAIPPPLPSGPNLMGAGFGFGPTMVPVHSHPEFKPFFISSWYEKETRKRGRDLEQRLVHSLMLVQGCGGCGTDWVYYVCDLIYSDIRQDRGRITWRYFMMITVNTVILWIRKAPLVLYTDHFLTLGTRQYLWE